MTPVGLLASGTAWGEWGASELIDLGLGFVPQGIAQFSGWWPAPLPDYGLPRVGAVLGYIISALAGIAAVVFLLSVLGRWLSRHKPTSPGPLTTARAAGVNGEGFLSRNVSSLTQALESIITADDLCRLPGFLQGLDARVKITTVFLFILVVGLSPGLWILGTLFVLVVLLSILSRIPSGFFFKRVFLFIPVFTALIAIPALFITPGSPWLTIAGRSIITLQGAQTAALLVLRVLDSLSLGVLFILTTPWTDFLAALRWFRLPSILVDILGMTYRYIFVLLHTSNSMFLARRSRTLGSFSAGENRRWLARALTAVLTRSQHLK